MFDSEKKYEVVNYKTESNECPMQEYLDKLKSDGRLKDISKIMHYINMLQVFGHELIHINEKAKIITNEIYELRPIPHRVLYFYHSKSGKYVLLHSFEKKKNKTPTEEIKRAEKEMNDYEGRL